MFRGSRYRSIQDGPGRSDSSCRRPDRSRAESPRRFAVSVYKIRRRKLGWHAARRAIAHKSATQATLAILANCKKFQKYTIPAPATARITHHTSRITELPIASRPLRFFNRGIPIRTVRTMTTIMMNGARTMVMTCDSRASHAQASSDRPDL